MRLTLEYFLKRQKKDLRHFVVKNKIKNYESLVDLCNERLLIPCSKKDFDDLFPKEKEKLKVVPTKKKRKHTKKKKTDINENN